MGGEGVHNSPEDTVDGSFSYFWLRVGDNRKKRAGREHTQCYQDLKKRGERETSLGGKLHSVLYNFNDEHDSSWPETITLVNLTFIEHFQWIGAVVENSFIHLFIRKFAKVTSLELLCQQHETAIKKKDSLIQTQKTKLAKYAECARLLENVTYKNLSSAEAPDQH